MVKVKNLQALNVTASSSAGPANTAPGVCGVLAHRVSLWVCQSPFVRACLLLHVGLVMS